MPPANSNVNYIEVPNLDQEAKVNTVAWQSYITHKIRVAIFQAKNTLSGLKKISSSIIKKT